ncbi:MAG: nitroreductase [Candidatus Verstraetearchaeota archaeon]|jgi:nitroreductase|uniref:Nitroreductase n=1 Tax=Thermoproteota archaeon TaxID=2056631 RepID=A0A523BE70_9CREN|nr:nitroreductase family protein [Candidatus Methanomethylicia archaeon]NHV61002.1 nitroreductase [Candidatus Verstraetearchaeota archaeon]TDA39249.1 MAG: nitroreductase [Candidatus Verstraetearchaeota archaeon]
MDALEAIITRRSVRSYMPDPVPREVLERILEAGRLAPSAMNLQPWHFIVVTDKEKRRALSAGRFARFLAEVPVVIVGCGNEHLSPKWYAIDTAIALQNMVIAATNEGLGSCWVGSFDEMEVKELLKIPEGYRVVAMLALGYPRKDIDLMGRLVKIVRAKKRLDEIVSAEEFNVPFERMKDSPQQP